MQSLPSPAESPSLKPKDLSSQPSGSRKRLRSQSMQSDTSSSSAKRSQSGGPSNDGGILVDDPTTTDIDAYMAEQGEADIPTTIQLPEPHQNEMVPSVSPLEKLSTIKKLRQNHLNVGDTWYIVARRWYKRWEKACTGEVDKEGGVEQSELGPIDNSPLLDKDENVTSGLVEGIDVEFVPKEAWELLVTWCVTWQHYRD
jgi:ubiquitin carboxyl-terminal hydrolase 4/11/15